MKRLGRTDKGIEVEPLSFALLLLAAKMYVNQTKPHEDQMDVDTFMKFQILTNVVRDIESEVNRG